MKKLLTIKPVKEIVCLSESTISLQIKAGTFPKPINGKGKKRLWTEESISEWASRQSASENFAPLEINGPKQQKRAMEDFNKRQQLAAERLESHRVAAPKHRKPK